MCFFSAYIYSLSICAGFYSISISPTCPVHGGQTLGRDNCPASINWIYHRKLTFKMDWIKFQTLKYFPINDISLWPNPYLSFCFGGAKRIIRGFCFYPCPFPNVQPTVVRRKIWTWAYLFHTKYSDKRKSCALGSFALPISIWERW